MSAAPAETQDATTAPALPELRLRLPGSWWQVPLHDRDEARASVRRLVAVQVGPSDDRTSVRIELERRVLSALDDAIDGDGQAFHVALSIVPGVPLAVTAMVALPAQQLTPAIGTSASATMAILERGLADLTEGGADSCTASPRESQRSPGARAGTSSRTRTARNACRPSRPSTG
ncbi:hypothetical protein NKG05_14850 [Oerskovia sp. M15]